MNRIRKGDTVVVIAGKEKGKTGRVTKILADKDRVVVEGLNQVKKHLKPKVHKDHPDGGIITLDGSIHISNVMLWDEETKRGVRVGYQKNAEGKKVRVSKATGKAIA
ncbi:MAG: 50S ribosomal protein L24 [Myxococcota bacterium]|nr:50S ribosomal protein L24 [Myxococcota bacterium]